MDNNLSEADRNKKELIKSIYKSCISENDNGIDSLVTIEYTPEDILRQREERVHRQEWLIKDYFAALVSMRVNYPGLNKNNCISLGIMKILCRLVVKAFKNKIMFKDFQITAEGPVLTLVINEDSQEIKRRVIDLEEEHPLGRFVDIDVYDNTGKSISREELGLKPRKCYICDDYAHNCVRCKKHGIEEIKTYIKDKFQHYLSDNVN